MFVLYPNVFFGYSTKKICCEFSFFCVDNTAMVNLFQVPFAGHRLGVEAK